MRKIKIHIGQAKTGTTTLQKFLLKNRENLKSQGVFYPKPNFGNNHGELTIPFSKTVQRSMVRFIGSDYEVARRNSVELWKKTLNDPALNDCKTLLLSSEFFFSAPGLKRIPEFIENISNFKFEIELIAYIRTPSEHFVSMAQQHLKASDKICRPPKLKLERLQSLSSTATLKIRKFSKESLVDGDILSDFCLYNGIDKSKFKKLPHESNRSICAEGMILLQEYRRKYHPGKNNIFTNDTKDFVEKIVSEQLKNPDSYTKPMLRPEFSESIDGPTPANEWLKEFYGIDLTRKNSFVQPYIGDIEDVQDVRDLIFYDENLLNKLRGVLYAKMS
ncbi:hypothetical protein Q4511_13760 [Paracoccus sp. 1_MG-2023]|uniref:hypothetical protein n=1 Tax=unclassified Paracoccus (in: a-proteobacteria) TaxID=2688777 RepID=UPI001C088930|nr:MULTISPECIES: hypothetical protein [unclassified Paracoccus (in: a-proteobacteria)]MBU2958916.1 hypothetical protein [Paracoccus sp. C2R09]MDO6669994.1 hypothetical protein [Paracoccus sp. 1_MG-2023]